ncbi:TOX high mobility group box family member 4-like [Adelges cooleyi]|uniref:TOX high mobility group box family member 4-like n=1 Tax=Adelges cooleyi TaxID=133065 RepID=UPI0021806F53|nr:TOX high mobility group box family member 4-like [Adelges cooleyi]
MSATSCTEEQKASDVFQSTINDNNCSNPKELETTQLNTDNSNKIMNSKEDKKTPEMCILEGCKNAAISHPEWDNEYCSVTCCYEHCKTTFHLWLEGNKIAIKKVKLAIDNSDAQPQPMDSEPGNL